MYSILVFLLGGVIYCDGFAHTFVPNSSLNSNKNSNRSITVMASVAEPFVIYDRKSSTLKGLDVDIINNFAQKHKLNVKFVLTDEIPNEVFKDGVKITAEYRQRQRKFLESISKL